VTTRTEFRGVNGHDVIGARHNHQGETVYVTRPADFPRLGWLRRGEPRQRRERREREPVSTGGWLLIGASILLAALAVAMGIVSWHAQYAFVYAIKHQKNAAGLESLGLDAGAVIFAVLGIALALKRRRAVVERVLVVACSAGSCAMNTLAVAHMTSPRDLAIYAMPAVLFAAASDRLIAVIRCAVMGPAAGRDKDQRSAFQVLGLVVLYALRFVVAAPSTLGGGRRALLAATPLPGDGRERGRLLPPASAHEDLPEVTPGPGSTSLTWPGDRQGEPVILPEIDVPADAEPPFVPDPPRPAVVVPPVVQIAPDLPPPDDAAGGPREGTKTAELLRLAAERYRGSLAAIDLADTARIATALAPEVDMHPGSARTALRAAVLAAQAGGAR
jgi:hypothetical protein